eukprot:3942871-Alexandrium_andersonii.AAC.1
MPGERRSPSLSSGSSNGSGWSSFSACSGMRTTFSACTSSTMEPSARLRLMRLPRRRTTTQ